MKNLQIGGDDLGVIHGKKIEGRSKIWLTAKPDASWWIVVEGPDRKVRTVGFVRPPQEQRARDTYDALSMPHVLGAFLEGRDSDVPGAKGLVKKLSDGWYCRQGTGAGHSWIGPFESAPVAWQMRERATGLARRRR